MNERMGRRSFLRAGAAASVGAAIGSRLTEASSQQSASAQAKPGGQVIWANLLHLGFNMWYDWDVPELKGSYSIYKPDLRFDRGLWDDILKMMVQAGMNMVIIDLGDGVRYESHPEIAVKNAWTTAQLRAELAKIRKMGLEPIPKMNFSTTHDTWLGPYARCVSTDKYYAVCRELIAEVIKLFDKPRFFHLGMDEEDFANQKYQEYVVIRQYDLWWRDFLFYVEQVEKDGVRPWIWSDYSWHHPDLFFKKMPKSVLQSNWYYDTAFNKDVPYVKAYQDLDEHGYEQVPTGSNWTSPKNFGMTVEYCQQHIAAERLLGFMQTTWKPTLEACRQRHMEAIDQVAEASAGFRSAKKR
jgi:hypothetical protein